MNYQEARAYLNQVSKTGSIYGLETIGNLMNELGNPQDELKFVHLAGTNGKGSILAYTTSILKSAGYTVGAYISPSVMGYLEKFQINCKWMEETELAPLVERVKTAAEAMVANGKAMPTVFEMETAIAFLYFKEKNCDYVVLECGLGGATDSTNIVSTTEVAAFAAISLDHIQILGNTVAEIAEKKSGIIKQGCSVVAGWQQPEVMKVLSDRAADLGCSFVEMKRETLARDVAAGEYMQQFRYGDRSNLVIKLLGGHQLENAAVAIEIADALNARDAEISESAIRTGLESACWPGRFEVIDAKPLYILDGAHNEDAARRLAEGLTEYFPDKKLYAVVGMFRDKNCSRVAELIAPHIEKAYTINLPNSERTLGAEELKEVLINAGTQAYSSAGIREAIDAASSCAIENDTPVLITGSLSYLGEAREYITQHIKGE